MRPLKELREIVTEAYPVFPHVISIWIRDIAVNANLWRAKGSGGIDRQAQAAEILIEAQNGDTVKDAGNDNVRDGVAEGRSLVLAEFSEDLLRGMAYRLVVTDDEERRLDDVEKLHGQSVVCPVSEQGNGFADHVPRGTERKSVLVAESEDIAGPLEVRVLRDKRSEEEGGVAEGFPVREVQGRSSAA